MILCSAAATYIVYTYLSPILTDTLGLPEGAVSPLLLVMGACSAVSNLLSGALGERGGLKTLPWAFAAQAVLFALLPLLLGHLVTGLAGIFAMGLLMYLLNTPAQMHALSLAERDYPFASSLCASMQPVSYNFGIAIGSFIGSAVQAGWGFRPLGAPAAVIRPGGAGAEPAASAGLPPAGRPDQRRQAAGRFNSCVLVGKTAILGNEYKRMRVPFKGDMMR